MTTLLANPTTMLTNRDALDRMATALRAWATLTLEAWENVQAARRDVNMLNIVRPCSEQELADVETFCTGLLGLDGLPALLDQLAPEPEHGTACTCCERHDPAGSRVASPLTRGRSSALLRLGVALSLIRPHARRPRARRQRHHR